MAWSFGIMANVPSVYVLASKPVPSRVDDGAERILWKIARGWSDSSVPQIPSPPSLLTSIHRGLTFGPVFAVVLVVLLRAGVPRQKRMAFIALVFAMSLAVMLLLNNILRDETWSVLDMLALSISFCGVTAYIVTSEPRGRIVRGEDPGLEGGDSQHLQPNVGVNQVANSPHIPQAELEAHGDPEVVQSSIPSDG